MKHILIYLAVALVMFGLLGWYFTRQDDIHPQATPTNLTTSNVAKQSQQTVKMLFADMSSEEKNAFRTALMSELDDTLLVEAHDCMGSAEVQLTYAKRVLEQGCTVLLLEPVDEATADELLSLAASYDVPVVMMNRSATPAQLAAYDKVYGIVKAEDTEEAELLRLADTIAEYWKTNREQLNFRLLDGKLGIATVTDYDLKKAASGKSCKHCWRNGTAIRF